MHPADMAPLTTPLDGRARILDAARQLFTQHGFKAVSMQQIADAASVNKATLYHHFADKEALFVEVLRHEFDHVHAQLNPANAERGSLRAEMIAAATRIFASHSHDIGRLMADLRENVSPERRTELMAKASPPWESLASMFDAAKARGETRDLDPVLLSRLFFVMIASQLGWTKFGGCDHPNAETAATIVDILLDGVRPGPVPTTLDVVAVSAE